MASNLEPVSIAAPGFYGLNLQDSPVGLPPEYALEASNCVIDRYGRVGARKGWAKFSATEAGIGTADVTLIHEFINTDGSVKILFIANGHIWSMDPTTGAVTDVYTGTWSSGDDNWKAVTFNGYAWFFKRGEDPLRYAPGSPGTVAKINSLGGYLGTVQQANEVLSSYGRLWTADTSTDKLTIKFSDLLIGEAWSGGSSGSLNIEKVLTNGTRPIVALAAFNGYLVVFCDTTIVVYQGADVDPATNLELVDVIDGVGCISRDSIQDVGSDILFLSDTGVRSLGRVIDQKSAPLEDISRNVRDKLIEDVGINADNESIKSAYSDLEGFYLLTLPTTGTTYCFDLKNRLENNICRTTTWTLTPNCFMLDKQKRLFMGFAGYVGSYSGYYDNDANGYVMVYQTSHLAGSEEHTPSYKILKNCRLITVDGSGYTINLLWGFDYQGLSRSSNRTLGIAAGISEWNIAEWGIGEYGTSSTVNILNQPLSGFGQVFQFSIQCLINGQALSIQQLDIYSKIGRLA